MSKGGSTTSQVQIPSYLSDAARRNLARADVIGRIGYTPYFGPDVAAMTPMQQAAIQGTNQMASAFGLPSVSDPMAGMPQPQDFGGMQAYSSAPMYEQSLQQLAQQRPAQYQAIEGMFNPTGGTSYGGGYGSGGGYGTTTSGGGVNLGNLAGTALAGYGAYKAIPAVASKVGGLLGLGSSAAGEAAIEAIQSPVAEGAVQFITDKATQQTAEDLVKDAVVKEIAPELGSASGAVGTSTAQLLSAFGAIAPIVGLGAFGGVPSGKETVRSANEARNQRMIEQNIDPYKSMVENVTGMSYGDYIASKMPPTSPFQSAINAIKGGDRAYEEEQIANYYQTPQGKQEMANYYAANPEFFTPTGQRVYSGPLAAQDQAAYNATLYK